MKRVALAAILLGCLQWPAQGAQDDAGVGTLIATIRAMAPADAQSARRQRQALDDAWRYFGNHREAALPALRQALAQELAVASPNPLLLLDAGFFLHRYGNDSDRALALRALLAIPPQASVDRPQLFRFAHALAGSADARLPAYFDQAFLHASLSVPVPQEGVALDAVPANALLYGRIGDAGERHLAARLAQDNDPRACWDVPGHYRQSGQRACRHGLAG